MKTIIITCNKCKNVLQTNDKIYQINISETTYHALNRPGTFNLCGDKIWQPPEERHYCESCKLEIVKEELL